MNIKSSVDDRNLKKAGSYYLIGTLFNKGISFLMVPVFTRILSTSDYGIVNTYDSWIGIFSTVMGLAIYMGIRASFVDYKDKIDDFLAVCLTFTLISGLALCSIISVVAFFIRFNVSYIIMVLCLFHGLASAIIQDYSMYLMMRVDYKFRTLLMVLPNLSAAIISIGIILFVTKSERYMGRIVPTAIINTIVAAILVVLTYRKSKVLFNREYLRYALGISVPLVVHGIALYILSQSDRTMITLMAGASQTGIYSLIYNFGMITVVATTAVEGIWVPWFYEKLGKRRFDEINLVAKDYIHIMTYILVGVIAVGPEVVKLLSAEQYWEGITIIPPIVLANYMIFAYTFYVNIEHYYKKTKRITYNTLIAAGCNLILNYLFIPSFGYVAAAYTTMFSYLVAFIFHSCYAKRLEEKILPLQIFLMPIIHLAITLLLFYIFLDHWYVRWTVLAVYLIYSVIKERKRIEYYFPSIRTDNKRSC